MWLLCEDGRRIRAVDPFVPACYLAAPPSIREQVFRLLRRASCRISTREVERYELGAPRPTPMLEVSVHAPAQFSSLTQQLIRACPDAQFFHVDVSLPQRYFYDRQLFPLVHCEADLTAAGRIQSIQVLESPWDTDYGLPPLAIMELSPDNPSPNPNHGGRGSLVVRMEGDERLLEGDDADVIQRLNQLLVRQDPDILLTDWGDSYLLPRLMTMADRLRMPLALNRDSHRSVGTRKPHSYFSYGRILSHADARTLSGRLHLDRHNSFAPAEMGLPGSLSRPVLRRSICSRGPRDDRDGDHLDAARNGLSRQPADSLSEAGAGSLQIRARVAADRSGRIGVRADHRLSRAGRRAGFLLDVSLHHDALQYLARDGQLPMLPS